MLAKKRLLAIVAQGETFAKIEPLFQRAPLEVHRASDGATGLILCRNVSYELIISEFPVPGCEEDLLDIIRAPESPCREAPVLLLGDGETLEYAARHDDSALYVAGLDSAATETQQRISGLLGISIRLASRVLVQIEVEVCATKTLRACQTHDISISGMLLRTGQQLPTGSEVAASFYLPGDTTPLQSKIRVVRHTDPMREHPGMGVQFTWLSEDDRERLQKFINRGLSELDEAATDAVASPQRPRGFDRFARLGS